MIVGCLGDLIFQVSSDTVLTVSNFVESASTRYAIHQRHNNSACLEYTGMDPDQLTFDIELSEYLGVYPQSAINILWSYIRSGQPVSMVLGRTVYGNPDFHRHGRWRQDRTHRYRHRTADLVPRQQPQRYC